MKNSKKKLPKYDFGGNLAKSIADVPLSALGMSNIIPDDAYIGNSAQGFRAGTNMLGTVGQTALPFALQSFGVPMPVTRMAQNTLGTISSMPYGGMSGANAELEKQENTLNPDGSTTQFNGPSHSNGGIPTQLDPGTLVFSDRLKLGKKTFAELNKPYSTKKEDKILNDSKATARAKVTADIMKMAKNKASIDLFNKQEAVKADKIAKYAQKVGYAYGGKAPDLYTYGGKLPKYGGGGESDTEPDTVPGYTRGSGLSEVDRQLAMEPGIMFGDALNGQLYGDDLTAFQNSLDKLPPQGQFGGNKLNISPVAKQIALGVGQNIGNIYDLYRSRPDAIETRTYNRFTPETLDPTQSIRDNEFAFRSADRASKQASVGNSATYLNSRRALMAKKMMTNTAIRNQYENQNAAIRNQAGMYNNQLGNREIDTNAMIQANARNIRANALSNIGQNVMGQVGQNNMVNRDKDYLMMIAKTNPEVIRDPEIRKYLGLE